MALQIAQDSEYAGNDFWRWSIWLAGPDAELDAVHCVVYTLHSSFPNPVRTVTDRQTRFRLETAGWGTFTIYARVVGKEDGTEQHLEHELDLRYPEDDAPAPA
jgi:transcription initiation factor IIF auxiliary subunit